MESEVFVLVAGFLGGKIWCLQLSSLLGSVIRFSVIKLVEGGLQHLQGLLVVLSGKGCWRPLYSKPLRM